MDGLLDLEPWRRHYTGPPWSEVQRIEVEGEALAETIREATRHGYTLGSEAFVVHIGRALGRVLARCPRGAHPRKGWP